MESAQKTSHSYVLKIAGVPGKSTLEGYETSLKIHRWKTEVTFPDSEKEVSIPDTPQTPVMASHRGLFLEHDISRGAVVFAKKIFEGQFFEEGSLICLNNEKEYFTLEMKNIFVRSIKVEADLHPVVTINLTYDEIEWIYTGVDEEPADDKGVTKAKHVLDKNMFS